MTDSSKVRALMTRAFNDAGIGATFAKGDRPLLDGGVFENYRAAGLATAAEAPAETPPEALPEPKAAPESPNKSKAKGKAGDKPADAPAATTEIPPDTQAE